MRTLGELWFRASMSQPFCLKLSAVEPQRRPTSRCSRNIALQCFLIRLAEWLFACQKAISIKREHHLRPTLGPLVLALTGDPGPSSPSESSSKMESLLTTTVLSPSSSSLSPSSSSRCWCSRTLTAGVADRSVAPPSSGSSSDGIIRFCLPPGRVVGLDWSKGDGVEVMLGVAPREGCRRRTDDTFGGDEGRVERDDVLSAAQSAFEVDARAESPLSLAMSAFTASASSSSSSFSSSQPSSSSSFPPTSSGPWRPSRFASSRKRVLPAVNLFSWAWRGDALSRGAVQLRTKEVPSAGKSTTWGRTRPYVLLGAGGGGVLIARMSGRNRGG